MPRGLLHRHCRPAVVSRDVPRASGLRLRSANKALPQFGPPTAFPRTAASAKTRRTQGGCAAKFSRARVGLLDVFDQAQESPGARSTLGAQTHGAAGVAVRDEQASSRSVV